MRADASSEAPLACSASASASTRAASPSARRCRRSSVMTTQLRGVVGRSCRAYPGGSMRRFLLSCAILAVLAVPAAAGARASTSGKPGYVVVRRAVGDGGANGSPAVILVVRQGFVLGRVSQEAKVDVYHLGSAAGQFTPQVKGDVSITSAPRWNSLPGRQYSGSNFRFRITGGFYRVVVRGSGIYA